MLFLILALAPGDPMGEFALDPSMTPEIRARIRENLGLDAPLTIRYFKWIGAFVQGDMGYSFTIHTPVRLLLMQRLPPTLWIVGSGYLLSILLALPLGILSALKPNSLLDQFVSTFSLIGFSLPTFITGMVAILVFSVHLDWFPFIYTSTVDLTTQSGIGAMLKQSVMPILVLALFQTAALLRFVRSSVLEQVQQEYVTTARAKGLRDLVIVHRHVLRNALLPVVTMVALGIPGVFTGALVTEQLFRVPGIGSLLVSAMQNSDTPVIMAITFLYAILIVMFNLVADILYGILDPRVRY